MINASELRIGNWVMLYDKHISKVISISKKAITTYNPNNVYTDGTSGDDFVSTSDFIQPIPLTPELLEVCGFVEHNDISPGYILDKNGFYFYFGFPINTSLHNILSFGIGHEEVKIKMPYLHQLQNIYFALIGTEIEVKLPQFAS